MSTSSRSVRRQRPSAFRARRSIKHRRPFKRLASLGCCHRNGGLDRVQAHAQTDGVRGTTPGCRADGLQFSDRRTNRPALPCLDSPTQHRSSAAASKKTSVSPQPGSLSFTDRRLIAAYEELRSQAVQGLRRGPGLALMMTRGFRCWMEACTQLFAHESSNTHVLDRPACSVPSGFRGELVILLASMLLHRASKEMA